MDRDVAGSSARLATEVGMPLVSTMHARGCGMWIRATYANKAPTFDTADFIDEGRKEASPGRRGFCVSGCGKRRPNLAMYSVAVEILTTAVEIFNAIPFSLKNCFLAPLRGGRGVVADEFLNTTLSHSVARLYA